MSNFRINISGLSGHRNIVAINFVNNGNLRKLHEIERSYSTRIYEMPMNSEWKYLLCR